MLGREHGTFIRPAPPVSPPVYSPPFPFACLPRCAPPRADPAGADLAAGADAARVAVKLTIFLGDGSVADAAEVAVSVDTAAGCQARPAAPAAGDGIRVKWIAVGFGSVGAGALLALHSTQTWLASVTTSVQRIDSDASLRLDTLDGVLLLVVNGQEATGAHKAHALLQRLLLPQRTARVGVLHLVDPHGAAAKHFYSSVDFVLAASCRGAKEREHEVCVLAGFGSVPLSLSPPSLQPVWLQDRVAAPEYVWVLLGWAEHGAAVSREALIAQALRYSGLFCSLLGLFCLYIRAVSRKGLIAQVLRCSGT